MTRPKRTAADLPPDDPHRGGGSALPPELVEPIEEGARQSSTSRITGKGQMTHPHGQAYDVAQVMQQLGAGTKGECDVWRQGDDRDWYFLDTIDVVGFSIPGIRSRYGAGRFKLDIYRIGADGRRKRAATSFVSIGDPSADGPRQAPTSNVVAGPAADGASAQATAALMAVMTTALTGLASAFSTLKPTDPIDLIAKLGPIMRPATSPTAPLGVGEMAGLLSLMRELRKFGDESGPAAPATSAMAEAIRSAGPLLGAITQRLLAAGAMPPELAAPNAPPGAVAQPDSVAIAAPPAAAATTTGDPLMDLVSRVRMLGPYIAFKLAAGAKPVRLARRLVDDLGDMTNDNEWGLLLEIAARPDFVDRTFADLAPTVPAPLHPALRELIDAVATELRKAAAEVPPAA